MMRLTFDRLREANIARLPLFRNRLGAPAHVRRDGSDWSDAQWLEALVGEIGEYANLHKKFVRGDITHAEFYPQACDELADVAVYLDLLAFRLGINLGAAIVEKFNSTSERMECEVILPTPDEICRHARAHPPGGGKEGAWPCPDCGSELIFTQESHHP